MNFGVIGYKGRMGKLILELFQEHNHTPVLLVDKNEIIEKEKPDVIIDFSNKDALETTIYFCKKYSSNLVIGTTALKEEHFKLLKELSENVAVVQSYNFSIGINILLDILEKYSKIFEKWDCEIVETHHSKKKDKPSGTAILLKNTINRNLEIHSLRLGGIPGDHAIFFSNEGELIQFSHRALSRKVFALGALKAAEFVMKKTRGFFTFKDILKEEI
ncbi:4-hydroxy-tetrahydrodipicolinate reductase [Thermosipho atlanticus]|uniref:4-hydroxy-tetrahydrodipicolinate reductase n=1 Tax=Thermosipho atlanticus DSM 15807 TaxID=1123380 RepID=A0A1M5SK34_9BACT|nr:dihydrodipicolinate reductase C-terminal domain-containing protein [Thermosipho atlanticus]SHH38957.1 dihydrodipicolinate reductase [Thermosipho atlanticus DSM 15807]